MANCHGKNSRGEPCKMAAVKGDRYCFNHSPGKAQERARARKRGGEARHTPHAGELGSIPADIATIEDARQLLNYVMAELLVMDNGIQRARALIALFEAFTRSFEIGELEERIAALEERIK